MIMYGLVCCRFNTILENNAGTVVPCSAYFVAVIIGEGVYEMPG